MDSSPPNNLVVVVVGVMEVRDNPSQVPEGRVHKDRYLHSLVSSKEQSCWTCGGAHIRKDCPQESGGRTLANGFKPTQVQCDNCGRVGHSRERCFDLYPKLRLSRGGGRGRVAQRGHDGRGGKGGGGGKGTPTVGAPLAATPPPMI